MIEHRWFAASPLGAVAIKKGHFTEAENIAAQSITEYMRRHRGTDCELMHCLDIDGSKLFDSNTGIGEIDLTPLMRASAQTHLVRFWHNHPSCDSLSPKDWKLASSTATPEILAMTIDGSIFVGRVPDYQEVFPVICNAINGIADRINSIIYSNIPQTLSPLPSMLASLRGHIINTVLSELGYVYYCFDLCEKDAETLAGTEALDCVAIAKKVTGDEIKRVVGNLPT